jgi:general secretion pathway protein M
MKVDSLIKGINLSKLSRREKLIVAGGGCLLVLFVLVQFVITPFFERRAQLERAIKAKTAMLAEMHRMRAEVESLRAAGRISEARYGRRDKNFTLFSFLDQLAGKSGIKERVSYMKPSKTEQKGSPYKLSRVEMKLEAVTLEQLAAYLYGVEASRNMVAVSKLSVSRREQKEGLLDAILQVDTQEM